MEDFSNYFTEKDYKTSVINHISESFEDQFSEAIDVPIREYLNELKSLTKEVEELDNNLTHEVVEETGRPIQQDIDIYMHQADIKYDIYWLEEQLKAMAEMKIVYLFKSLEITMKKLVETAYPQTKTNRFYRWENFKTFFKNKDISLHEITGYEEVVELRKVNNNIKHKPEINESVKKIEGFNNEKFFHFNSLNDFYNRIKLSVDHFLEILSSEVIDELFEFPESRIETLASEYHERMDKSDAEEFSEKLLSKYKS